MSGARKLGLSEDWAVVPFMSLTMLGFAATVYDFTIIQNLSYQLSPLSLLGLAMFSLGGYLRFMSRRQLMRAGLTMLGSSRLVTVEGQRLVTDGLYRRIRHPLYLGEMTRNLGFTLILTSGYGFALVLLGSVFLLFRIPREERMMLEEFGDEYREYMRRTWRLIPHVY
ncbi:MAG TPA: isoprenylcysteine carboxylmethyltransferase family protein [Candidatus Desulfaltia sp.]|nr:isoprenylcysteine carboxylmethyltransferase family protein [Candidatus Desulfaltia sp.]